MADKPPASPSRQARLAAKLRENLRRRKTQARALDGASDASAANPGLSKPGDDG